MLLKKQWKYYNMNVKAIYSFFKTVKENVLSTAFNIG